VVIQNDVGNRFSPTVIVAAITSAGHSRFDVHVEVRSPEGSLTRDSLVLLNQIRTVYKSKLTRHWGHLTLETMAKVDNALRISLGLVPL